MVEEGEVITMDVDIEENTVDVAMEDNTMGMTIENTMDAARLVKTIDESREANAEEDVKEIMELIISAAEESLFPEGGPKTKNEQLPDLSALELNKVEFVEGTLRPLGKV